MDNSMIKLAQ